MNKGVQTVLGIVLFVFILFPVIGSINGYSEANAFNNAKVEVIQRIRETGHDSTAVTEYVADMAGRLDDFKYEVTLIEDNDGDGVISYGDVIQVDISAKGSGSFNFKKSAGQVTEEGRDEDDNLPHFQTRKQILVDRRADTP